LDAISAAQASNVKELSPTTHDAVPRATTAPVTAPVTTGLASREVFAPAPATFSATNSSPGRAQLPSSTAPLTSHEIDRLAKIRAQSTEVTPVARVTSRAPGKPEHFLVATPDEKASSPTRADVTTSPSVSPVTSTAKVSVVAAVTPSTSSVSHSLDVGKLAEAISRPVVEGDATYSVVVTMHPAELGHVQAVVTIDHRDIQVSITPQTVVGHDALASSVDALKQELARGGVNVNVTLHDHGTSANAEQRERSAAPRGTLTNATGDTTERPDAPTAAAAGQIHLIL
jgi:flagellar hook-length control protein FliK